MAGLKNLSFDIELLIGIAIFLVGAVLVANYYGYIPKDYMVPDETAMFIGGVGCVIGGGYLAIKKLAQGKGV